MLEYKGFNYFKDTDSLWKVIVDSSIFVVALDDSKIGGNKRIIESKNNETTCQEFINWITKK